MGRFASKPASAAVAPGSSFVHEDKWATSAFPALWEYLTTTTYGDGADRQTSTLLFFCEGGLFKACLSDRENDRTAWATGESLEEVVLRLEESLASERVEWRRRPSAAGGKSRK